MKRFFAALCSLLFVALACANVCAQSVPAPAVKQSPVDTPKRVLFIGKSLVYYNGALQTHTHRIAAAATPPQIGRAHV